MPNDGPGNLKLPRGSISGGLARGFAHDQSRTSIGRGEDAFEAAKREFEQWAMFDLGWVWVVNPAASIATGQVVAVDVCTFGLWSLNLSRIVDVLDTGGLFGFIYATTAMHGAHGEESFLLELDESTGDVWYELEAVSHPQNALARLGFSVTRSFQRRFARDSHRRMQAEAVGKTLLIS